MTAKCINCNGEGIIDDPGYGGWVSEDCPACDGSGDEPEPGAPKHGSWANPAAQAEPWGSEASAMRDDVREALRAAEAALVDLGACNRGDCEAPCNGALAKVRAVLGRPEPERVILGNGIATSNGSDARVVVGSQEIAVHPSRVEHCRRYRLVLEPLDASDPSP